MKAIEFALQMLAEGLGFRVATGTAPQQCARWRAKVFVSVLACVLLGSSAVRLLHIS